MRSYLHTFDPLKEIPVICSELADVEAKLKRSAESSAAEVARKRTELESLESNLNKKVGFEVLFPVMMGKNVVYQGFIMPSCPLILL